MRSPFVLVTLFLSVWCYVLFPPGLAAQWLVVGKMPTGSGGIFHPADYPVGDVVFLTPETGYYYYNIPVFSNYVPPVGCISKTIDGGVHWFSSLYFSAFGIPVIKGFAFSGPDSCFALLQSAMFDEIYSSSNSGQSWHRQFYIFGRVGNITGAEDQGPYVTSMWNLYRATDTLHLVSTFSSYTVGSTKMKFFPDGKGYISADYNSDSTYFYLARTDDYGMTWTDIYHDDVHPFRHYQFPSQDHGFLIADSGRFTKTMDGGLTWSASFLPEPVYPVSFSFCDSLNGYVLGKNNILYRTFDGGASWSLQQTPVGYYLSKVIISSDSIAFLLARSGLYSYLLKTTNGGLIPNASTHEPDIEVIRFFPNPACGLVYIQLPTAIEPLSPDDLCLYNAYGQKVHVDFLQVSDNQYVTDISSLPSSLYLLLINTNEGGYVSRLIRQ